MTRANHSAEDRVEFPVVGEDWVSIVGPSIGIGILSCMAASVVFIFLAMTPLLRFLSDLPDDGAPAVLMFSGLFGLWTAVSFVRRRRRIMRERKLVIDPEGITYFRFANRRKLTRWDEVERVEERETHDCDGPDFVLRIDRIGRRPLRITSSDFRDYGRLKDLIRRRLPERTALAKAV